MNLQHKANIRFWAVFEHHGVSACDKLAASLQAQIDKIKSKGFSNLSKEDKNKYGALRRQLLVVEKAKAANAAMGKLLEIISGIKDEALSAGRKAQ
ncbi:MAG: hypothetical protein Q9M17_02800 [Mariprofundus sp.]|nr:hypothetical protein [Mariprofundus sp.]